MENDSNRQDTKKATIYDLQNLILRTSGLDQITVEKIIGIMDNYIDIAGQYN